MKDPDFSIVPLIPNMPEFGWVIVSNAKFETSEEAKEVMEELMKCYNK